MNQISTHDFKDLISNDLNINILDVRTPHEWNEGIIENAELLDLSEGPKFIEKIQTLDKDKNYYVYCRSGGRSMVACQAMEKLGFKSVTNVLGGITDWTGEVVQPK